MAVNGKADWFGSIWPYVAYLRRGTTSEIEKKEAQRHQKQKKTEETIKSIIKNQRKFKVKNETSECKFYYRLPFADSCRTVK